MNLVRTDGTAAGTFVVKASLKGSSTYDEDLQSVGDTLFFQASDPTHGEELWKTDGSASGTRIVADLVAGSVGSAPRNLTALGSTLIFDSNQGGMDTLWKTDGTAAGTMELSGSESIDNDASVVLGSSLLFAGNNGQSDGVWTTDGTAAGTREISDLAAVPSGDANNFTVSQGRVFFTSQISVGANSENLTQLELWTSDGTNAGTVPLGSYFADPASYNTSGGMSLVPEGSQVLFSAFDPTHGLELWSSDGTAAGTGLLADLDAGADGSDPRGLTSVGGKVFFAAHDGVTPNELWSSDGTATGTSVVARFANIETASSFVTANPYYISDHDNSLTIGGTTYFDATDPDHGEELWKTDGTAAGTVLVKDITPGPFGSKVTAMTAYHGRLYFLATDTTTRSLGSGPAMGPPPARRRSSRSRRVIFTPFSRLSRCSRTGLTFWRRATAVNRCFRPMARRPA